MQQAIVQDFFDQATNTFSYVVSDPVTKYCAIIDSVLDYDSASATHRPHMQIRLLPMLKHKV